MKKISAVWITGIFLFLFNIETFAQAEKTSLIDPYPLAVTYSKTTNLIFPYPIISIDKGSRDILVQKAIGVENVLQLKAAKVGFPETNLTVVTADGSLFSYVLNYADSPTGINIKVDNAQVVPTPVAVFTPDATNDQVRLNAEKVSTKRRSVSGIEDENHAAHVDVKGLYIHDDVLYFQFGLVNSSLIDYDIKLLRFFIKDKKKSKRTASQEIEIEPKYILGSNKKIAGNSEQVIVVAVPKFTIPDKKTFIVQMQEVNGGRNLQMALKNKKLIKFLKHI